MIANNTTRTSGAVSAVRVNTGEPVKFDTSLEAQFALCRAKSVERGVSIVCARSIKGKPCWATVLIDLRDLMELMEAARPGLMETANEEGEK